MDRRGLIRAALASGAAVAGARPAAAALAAPRVVYHLSDADKVAFVLGNIGNHIDGMGGPGTVSIALVVHGPPLGSFRVDLREHAVADAVAGLHRKGLALFACIHTLAGMHLTVADLVPGFVVAERGGVVKLADLQGQGWAYLRP